MRGLTVDCQLPFGPVSSLVEILYDVIVTGSCSPDCTGGYFYDGLFNSEPSYVREGGGYYFWASPGQGIWNIATSKGGIDPRWDQTSGTGPAGVYAPAGSASGIATAVEP